MYLQAVAYTPDNQDDQLIALGFKVPERTMSLEKHEIYQLITNEFGTPQDDILWACFTLHYARRVEVSVDTSELYSALGNPEVVSGSACYIQTESASLPLIVTASVGGLTCDGLDQYGIAVSRAVQMMPVFERAFILNFGYQVIDPEEMNMVLARPYDCAAAYARSAGINFPPIRY